MADYGECFTEEEFRKLRAKVEEVYREAYQDIVEKTQEWAEKHEKRARKYQRMVRKGKLSKADYDAWMRGQVFQGKQWQARKQQIEQTLYHADRVAQEMANNSRFNTFAVNANFMGYELEEHGRIDTGFTLYNPNTISRLVKDQPDLLPPKRRVGRDASYRWYNRQIGTVITQGIIQGETVREIAKRIGKKTGETNCSAMLRNARTMYTGAQNAGRLEGMRQAQRLGIRVQKRWVAILDNKTRDSHQALDGQIQDVEDPFESPLGHIMYPGDTGADDPADVWNCRCSMIYEHPDYPSKLDRRDAETGEIVGDMTYKEWAAMKAERAAQAEQTAQGDNPQPSPASPQPKPSGKTGLTGSGKGGTIELDDAPIRAMGATSPRNPNVINPETGLPLDYVIGRRPEYPPDHTMAGYGCKTGRQIDDIDRLVREYHASAERWQKEKARYWVYDMYSEERQVELHWYQHPDIGKVEHKIKFGDNGEEYVDDW